MFKTLLLAVLLYYQGQLGKASSNESEKIVIYNKYKYDTIINLMVNSTTEQILDFIEVDDHLRGFPTRVHVSTNDTINGEYPLFVTATQQKGVSSWELPLVVQTSHSTMQFNDMARTLCPHDAGPNITSENRPTIHMSTANPRNVTLSIKLRRVNDFYVQVDKITTYYFDAILFDATSAHKYSLKLSDLRAENQIYIFVSIAPPREVTIYFDKEAFNNVFNYTWTYKLNSDIPFNYLIVRNKSSGEVVGPKKHVNWANLEHVAVPDEVRKKLSSKTIAAAWFDSNCKTRNGRQSYVRKLQDVLKSYNLQLDIFGRCGEFKCLKEDSADCQAKIERDYYLYLVFEDTHFVDYVTDKLLIAVYYAVPVVFGGANYSRFMPDGAYLDARALGTKITGKKIKALIDNKTEYYNYFKWHRYEIHTKIWKIPRGDFIHIIRTTDFKETISDCTYRNCFITDDVEYFPDTTYFDAILFDRQSAHRFNALPSKRINDQIYIFTSSKAPLYTPTYFKEDSYQDDVFNHSFTYKTDSDIPFYYLIVRNKSSGKVVAPKKHVDWVDLRNVSVPNEVKRKLRAKRIAAVWFVSNESRNDRYAYARKLQDVLKSYNLRLDIFGTCSELNCPEENWDDFRARIEKDYYFYLAFENSNSADYVTEKLLTAVKHYAVPIVYGGADYSRFMTNGSYLDARVLGADLMGQKISELINNREEYYNFFRFHRYYSYHESFESPDTNPHCALFAFLNGDWRTKRRAHKKLSDWWYKDLPPTITDFNELIRKSFTERLMDTLKPILLHVESSLSNWFS